MDFSSIPRALESLSRRQPPLSPETLATAQGILASSTDRDTPSSSALIWNSVTALLRNMTDASRWEPLAVGLFVATEVLLHHHSTASGRRPSTAAAGSTVLVDATPAAPVYMDGPRVPSMTATGAGVDATAAVLYQILVSSSTTTSTNDDDDDDANIAELCRVLHPTCLAHLEHKEPRVRTLVAKAVGAYSSCCATTATPESSTQPAAARMVPEMHERLIGSIHEHISAGRDEHGNYSRTSTGAVDDTTGWRALETNWLCLASMVHAMSDQYVRVFPVTSDLLADCEFSSVTHVNRHVRAAAMQTLEQWVRAVTVAAAAPNSDDNVEYRALLTDSSSSKLRQTVIAVVRAGLADNWSQVRMAGSVLCRVWFTSLQSIGAEISGKDMTSALLPRMCLNRFYLAQGVKLYSHETWKLLFPTAGSGLALVVENLPAVCSYYVKMCDADNHVVREGACQAIAELAVRLGDNAQYHDLLLNHMDMLIKALLMCFFDESWPVRDEACLACGILCKAYPDACKPEFKTLWERWTDQLTDQIWSVREDAAIALGDALEAYGDEVMTQLRDLIRQIMPAAREQPAMSAAEYKEHVNDVEQHTDSTLYSCGSLAPKLRKGGAARIGCSNCGIDRPKAPWEVRTTAEIVFISTTMANVTLFTLIVCTGNGWMHLLDSRARGSLHGRWDEDAIGRR